MNRKLPPAVVVGGDHNALSIARSLARAGVQVHAINFSNALVRYSRFCHWHEVASRSPIASDDWASYLLGRECDHLRGAVLLAASDEGIELIARHREELSRKFALDLSDMQAQLCMLDKLCTYKAAQAAGVPTPKFWVANTREQVERFHNELVFPLILKPLLGHEFSRKFSGTFAVAQDFSQLLILLDRFNRAGVKTFLVELVPGTDDNLCSYYTYLDEDGNSLFDFTKRVIRRYPFNMGSSTYHITDDVPAIKELALALFHKVGLRGVANVEFKLDKRDGRLKLIECNARFTAADCLLQASGVDFPLLVYNRIIHREQKMPTAFQRGKRLWKPAADFLAFRQQNRLGLLSLKEWISSILHPQVFPIFRWRDPLPSIINGVRLTRLSLSRASAAAQSKETLTTDVVSPVEIAPDVDQNVPANNEVIAALKIVAGKTWSNQKTIGILYPGEMGSSFGKLLQEKGFKVVTTTEGRSERTRHLCREAGLIVLDSVRDVLEQSDVLISLVSPAAALSVAERIADLTKASVRKPLFIDANSISPMTVAQIRGLLEPSTVDFLDASIFGLASQLEQRGTLCLSGSRAGEMSREFAGVMRVKAVGEQSGQASALKMIISGIPKGLSALFIETMLLASEMDLLEESLQACDEIYPSIMEVMKRMLPTYPRHAGRRCEELFEVEKTMLLNNVSPRITSSVVEVTSDLSKVPWANSEPNEWTVTQIIQAVHRSTANRARGAQSQKVA